VNLLVENQLPPALARFVENEFRCSAIHVLDVGLRDASDTEVWRYASQTD
jgi:predicted nuclease of predicted toxin-antitoxin system